MVAFLWLPYRYASIYFSPVAAVESIAVCVSSRSAVNGEIVRHKL